MAQWIIQGMIGFIVGIYGYLMPNYINLGLVQLSRDHPKKIIWKIIGVISLIEIPYCFVCMISMSWLIQQETILWIIRWGLVVVLFSLALLTVKDLYKKKEQEDLNKMDAKQISMRRLLFLAIVNPFQLSAWAIWGSYFLDKTWFAWNEISIFIFSLGAAFGVGLVLWFYVRTGNKIIHYFAIGRKKLDYFIIVLMTILAIYQTIHNIMVY